MSTITETITRCPLCGAALEDDGSACTKCDWVPGYRQQQARQRRRNPRDIAAALLSLVIPGAGHFFKGYLLGGSLIMLGVPIISILAYAFTMFFGWLLIPVYWIAVAADAYFRADLESPGMRTSEVSSRNGWSR